jgi:hypothetical protein
MGSYRLAGCDCFCRRPVCALCTSVPARWQVTLTGLTHDFCPQVDPLVNDTWILRYLQPCFWFASKTISPACSGATRLTVLLFGETGFGSTSWSLRVDVGDFAFASATYRIAWADGGEPLWDCEGPNDMPFLGGPASNISGWPGSLLVSPA